MDMKVLHQQIGLSMNTINANTTSELKAAAFLNLDKLLPLRTKFRSYE